MTAVLSACETYTWQGGNTYTATNNSATDVLTNVAGCDSKITLNLTINNSTVSTDVQLACGDYTWIDGNTCTSSNNTATYLTTAGCDSTISLDLTITTIDNST